MPQEPAKPLMRSLGEFFGHILKGVKTDPEKPQPPAEGADHHARREIVRTQVEQSEHQTPTGKVVVRRTTIEEVETIAPAPPSADTSPPQ